MQRGQTRPPMMKLAASGKAVVLAEDGTGSRSPVSSQTPESFPSPRATASPFDAALAAAERSMPKFAAASAPKSAAKSAWEANPQFEFTDEVAMARAAQEAAVKKRREALRVWRWVGLAVGAVVLVGLANEAVSFLANDLPPTADLNERSSEIAQQVLRIYATPAQPLALDSAQAVLFNHEIARRANYDVAVTLQVRADLYARADSNGAQPYLLLQKSLAEAQAKVLRHSLYLAVPALKRAPELPQLLVLNHRAGEKFTVKVPLAAERSGWHWKFTPVQLNQRRANRKLTGEVIARFSDAPFIVFSTAAEREVMRQKMQAARDYIVAVGAALRSRGLEE